MNRFIVTIRQMDGIDKIYSAIANHVLDLHADAIDRFGPCKFSARLA